MHFRRSIRGLVRVEPWEAARNQVRLLVRGAEDPFLAARVYSRTYLLDYEPYVASISVGLPTPPRHDLCVRLPAAPSHDLCVRLASHLEHARTADAATVCAHTPGHPSPGAEYPFDEFLDSAVKVAFVIPLS